MNSGELGAIPQGEGGGATQETRVLTETARWGPTCQGHPLPSAWQPHAPSQSIVTPDTLVKLSIAARRIS